MSCGLLPIIRVERSVGVPEMDTFASYVAARLRQVGCHYLKSRARWQGKGFFCQALAGRSESNLSINSDLTVSCNCHDVDGSGVIGDLNRQSLAEILAGPIARDFRKRLAHGALPTSQCARCADLHFVKRTAALERLDHYQLPTFVMVENTIACNLRCVSCPRSQIRRLRKRPAMSLDDVRRVATELREAGVERIGYLNLGEPFLSSRIHEELSILREIHPDLVIGTSTNGSPLTTDEKRDAALLLDTLQFSLDGVSGAMVNKYQRGLDFDKAYDNMQALVQYRDARGLGKPTIIWKYLLFRWNEQKRHVLAAIELARRAGVDAILFERTVSPFYGLPWRSYLGLHRNLGRAGQGYHYVTLRPPQAEECPQLQT